MSGFPLDTHTLSYHLRGEGGVAERLAATSPEAVALPAVVLHVICCGLILAQRGAHSAAFERMVEVCRVLEVDAEVAKHAADIRWALKSKGTPIGPHDVLIAATARRHQHTLVTHNTKEFARVPALDLDDRY